MSGHSKWAGIKHKKAIIDSKRGKIFTKIAREITIAAKQGGGNPEHNVRLRKAIEDGKAANMPQDNIKRAVQKGTGEIPGVVYEELRYEGYGPAGVALLVEVTTDSRNRTGSEIRKIFSDHNGNVGESGSVAWMFSLKGSIAVEKNKTDEETLLNLALEAGAEDVKSSDEEIFEILMEPTDFEKVKETIEAKQIPILNAEITQIAQTLIAVKDNDAETLLKLVEALEDHDDVKAVYGNFDIPKEIMEKIL